MNAADNLRKQIASYKEAESPLLRFVYRTLRSTLDAGQVLYRLARDGDRRHRTFLKITRRGEMHQTTTLTALNRYPDIFSEVREYFDDRERITILSYGCSTGEEVITLRSYFPDAFIVGAEINKRCLQACRKRGVDDRIRFIPSTRDTIREHGPYDVIFCMAVFQREPRKHLHRGTRNISDVYPFRVFDRQLVELDRSLNDQGLLVVHYTQFFFTDSTIAARYRAHGRIRQDRYIGPVYDRNGDLVVDESPPRSIWIKQAFPG